MDSFAILARAAEPAMRTAESVEEGIVPINFIWEQIVELSLVEALAFICFGVVCLLYGWRIFKILVTLCFALVGLFGGLMINEKLVGGNGMWLGLMGVVMMGVLSLPLMRWGVSALGAVAGGILTGGIWYACALPDKYIWAGALAGLIAGGMISFIVFKLAVVLFTSFGGGALIVTAVLAVLHAYFDPEKVRMLVFDYRWFLPVAFIVPTLVGIIVQNKFISSSKDWNI
ncbi:MAG: hypothetical protein OEW48_07660 [Phycisphaerae bacterium]|nr:hypothetical protein [Phycisphaerae bacterium]